MARTATAMIMPIEPFSARFLACAGIGLSVGAMVVICAGIGLSVGATVVICAGIGLSVGATVVLCTKMMELWSTVTETPKFASIVLSSEPSASVVSTEDARAVESWCPEAARDTTTSKLIVHTYAVD